MILVFLESLPQDLQSILFDRYVKDGEIPTQEEIAQRLGLSRSIVGGMETIGKLRLRRKVYEASIQEAIKPEEPGGK